VSTTGWDALADYLAENGEPFTVTSAVGLERVPGHGDVSPAYDTVDENGDTLHHELVPPFNVTRYPATP